MSKQVFDLIRSAIAVYCSIACSVYNSMGFQRFKCLVAIAGCALLLSACGGAGGAEAQASFATQTSPETLGQTIFDAPANKIIMAASPAVLSQADIPPVI